MGIKKNRHTLPLLLFLVISFPLLLKSQSVEKEFANLQNCIDIEVAAIKILPDFYVKNQYDSIELALEFVKATCYESEALRISSILMAIQNRTFSDTMISDKDIYIINKEAHYIDGGSLFDFKHFKKSPLFSKSNFSNNYNNTFNRQNLERRMADMIIIWSNELLLKTNLSGLETSLLEHIAAKRPRDRKSKILFNELSKRKYNKSSVRKTYDQYHSNYLLNNATHFSLGYTQWVTTGAAENVYGNLPAIFCKLGTAFSKKDRVDMYFAIRFGKTRLPLNIVRPDTIFSSNQAMASLWGLDYSRSIWTPSRKLDLSLLVGIGIENRKFFSAYSNEEDSEQEELIYNKMGNSNAVKLYWSTGVEINYFMAPAVAINAGARYLFSNKYTSTAVTTNIQGNSILMQIGFSMFINGHPAKRSGFWNIAR